MKRRLRFLFSPAWLAFGAFFWAGSAQADGGQLDLLTRPGAALAYGSDVRTPLESLQVLVDGNSRTAYTLPDKSAAWEVVYDLGGETCTVQRLEIQLAVEGAAAARLEPCGTVQVLVSDLKERVGFQGVWVIPLYATAKLQTVDLPNRAARWIMLRITPARADLPLRLAEVHVLGRSGRPRSNYQFKETPANALDVLQKLKITAGEAKLGADEQVLFADARVEKLHSFSLAEAALIAAGVHDADLRRAYLKKITDLATAARPAVAAGVDPKSQAERLLAWMHQAPCNGGYQPAQSSLAWLLDHHTFNCVSATILFSCLARELNLEVSTVEVPTHVFSILHWGQGGSCDIENTSPWGVDPGSNPAFVHRLQMEKNLIYVSSQNPELRREVGDLGLVAMVYYNRGVLDSERKQHAEALAAYFYCLSLDPEFSQAVQNALAELNNWSCSLLEEKKYPQAVRVITAGMDLVPQDIGFQDTRRLVYTRWAEETLEQGNTENAWAVLREAAQADPGGNFEAQQALVFTQPAARLAAQKQWARALALSGSGLGQVPRAARLELQNWRQGAYLDWMRSGLREQDYASAALAMETALREEPENREFTQNLAFVAQTWAIALYKKQGRPVAEALLKKYHDRFPGEWMSQAAAGYAGSVLEDLRLQPGYAGRALALVSECEPLLPASRDLEALLQGLYEQTAQAQLQVKDFAAALEIYRKAQKRFPQDDHWLKGEDTVRDAWIRDLAGKKQWPAAVTLAEQAAGHTSDEAFFAQTIAQLAQAWAEGEAHSRGASGARALLDQLQARFPHNAYLPKLVAAYAAKPVPPEAKAGLDSSGVSPSGGGADDYDARGQAALEKSDWSAATAIYDEALKRYPQHARLRNNAAAAWDQWAQACLATQDWDLALTVCEKARDRSLNLAHFDEKIFYLLKTGGHEILQAEDLSAAGPWFARQRRRFPGQGRLPDLITALYAQALSELTLENTSRYLLRGTALIQSHQQARGAAAPDAGLIKNWCDRLAQDRLDHHLWQDALDMLATARKLLPQDDHLRSNEIAVWNLWAQTFIQAAQWELAEGIYTQALQRFPEESLFLNNLKYCRTKRNQN